MRFEVKTTECAVKAGVSAKGRPYEIREQTAYMHTPDEVRKVRVSLGQGQEPYAPGWYGIDHRSFGVDQYGALWVKLMLTPEGGKK